MDSKWMTYKQLELITDAPEPRFKFGNFLNKIGTWLLTTCVPSHEPRIWTKTNRKGVILWYIYDPVSDRKICCTSQAEVMSWLESRYYRP